MFFCNIYKKNESLSDLASLLSQQTDFSEILRVISTKTAAMFNSEVASIVMINPRTQITLKTVMKEEKEINEFITNQKTVKAVPLKESLQEIEKDLILKTFEENDWNRNKATRTLDFLEQGLHAKMNKLGIVRPRQVINSKSI